MSKRIDKRCYADLLFGREVNKFLRYLYFFMFAVFYSYLTNAFTASVIFFMRHWIKPKPGLSYVHVVHLNKVFEF